MLTLVKTFSRLLFYECARCGKEYSPYETNTYATCCNQILLAHYDTADCPDKSLIRSEDDTMWRYFQLLPVLSKKNIVSLGEGITPVLPLDKLAAKYGFQELLMKDESYNPTFSFKARGISVAVSKAKELGIKKCIIPTAGNAGGALAAYCAKASIECTVVMPRKTPEIFKDECLLYGANLVIVDGLINDCAKKVQEINHDGQYFDVSTMKEPYRLEGKKTMGYEIAEKYEWQLPDVILYPAGGGTGLIGIWKAFEEMKQMGWLPGELPKMIAVQSENCAPIQYAMKYPDNWKERFVPCPSVANGLAVPYPFAMDTIRKVLLESGGCTCTVSEEKIISSVKEIAMEEGMLVSPEGAATWSALQQLVATKKIDPSQKILLLNTGTGYKYINNILAKD